MTVEGCLGDQWKHRQLLLLLPSVSFPVEEIIISSNKPFALLKMVQVTLADKISKLFSLTLKLCIYMQGVIALFDFLK